MATLFVIAGGSVRNRLKRSRFEKKPTNIILKCCFNIINYLVTTFVLDFFDPLQSQIIIGESANS